MLQNTRTIPYRLKCYRIYMQSWALRTTVATTKHCFKDKKQLIVVLLGGGGGEGAFHYNAHTNSF